MLIRFCFLLLLWCNQEQMFENLNSTHGPHVFVELFKLTRNIFEPMEIICCDKISSPTMKSWKYENWKKRFEIERGEASEPQETRKEIENNMQKNKAARLPSWIFMISLFWFLLACRGILSWWIYLRVNTREKWVSGIVNHQPEEKSPQIELTSPTNKNKFDVMILINFASSRREILTIFHLSRELVW